MITMSPNKTSSSIPRLTFENMIIIVGNKMFSLIGDHDNESMLPLFPSFAVAASKVPLYLDFMNVPATVLEPLDRHIEHYEDPLEPVFNRLCLE